MVVNKGAASAPTTVTLANAAHGAASEVWQLTAANAIARLADVPVSGAHAPTATLPAQSVTLFVIPRGTPPTGPPAAPTGVRIIP
jgi:O-glycosyl hydrolase